MADTEIAPLPPKFGESGFFANLIGIGKENLAGDRKHLCVSEAVEQGLEEIRFDAHVAIEQNDDIVAGGAEPSVRSTAEAEIVFQRDHANLRESLANEVGAAIGRTIVDHDDFASGDALRGGDYGRQIFFE